MPSLRFGFFSDPCAPRSLWRQRGAAIAEYLPPLSFIVLLSVGAYGQYGETLRTQMSQAANKFAENYYHGWFWPETTAATSTPWGAPANGTQGTEGPSTSSTGSGGASNGSGTSTDNTPGGDGNSGADAGNESGGVNDGGSTAGGNNPGNNTGGGLSNQAANDLANLGNSNSGLGSAFLSGGTGAGGEPMQCTGGGSNTTNPFSTPSSSPTPQSSPAADNAPSFTALGNPIDIGTGNKFQAENDYTGMGANALLFSRYYNSVLTHSDGGVGPGWRHSYQRAVVFDAKKLTATVWRDDGTQYVFNVPDQHGIAPLGVIDQLERTDSGWTYTTGGNDRERYDAAGHLQRIDYATGQVQTVIYNSQGQLVQIRDARGPSITLNWRGQHLHSIELPTRQRIGYRYDDALNLRRVVRGSDNWMAGLLAGLQTPERQYHYDDKRLPHALTGLDDATGARYATWAYDQAGRGILSQHGDGAEKVRIAYQAPLGDGTRRVTVTNALGLKATYTLEPARAGKYRLKDIEGQPMISCAAVQSHHRYDDNGFVHAQFNADRIGNLYTRNRRGLMEIEQRGVRFDVREQVVATEGATRIERQWDKSHPWLLSEIHSSWTQTKNETGHWQPTAKREFSYDERGHVLADTLTDLSEHVMPYSTKGEQHTRTTHYEFANAEHTQLQKIIATDANSNATIYQYNNEQLHAIENPLHQLTRFDNYNAYGQAERVQLPNGQTLQIRYNAQGLPAQLTRDSGEQKEISAADYDAAGRLTHLTRPDGSEQFYRYNSAGQLTQIKNHWGETLSLTPNALTGAWEVEQLRNTAGELVQNHQRRFNAQGQLSALIGNAGQQTDFHYSANGDLIQTSERDQNPANENLAHTTKAHYDTQHRLLELIDAAGYATQYEHSASGTIEAVTDANHNTTHYVRNGFGDLIEQDSPTTGSVIKRYDANGNVIANQSPGGEGVKFEYDALNRITKVDYAGEQNDIRYTYDQADNEHGNGVQQLTRIDTQIQAVDYRYDESGRKVQETTTDKDRSGKLINKTTLAYHYLPGSRLDRITYPDGSVVHYHFDKDRITDVTYTAANAKSKEEKTILKDIAYAPFGGPVNWSYGNGLKQTKQLDQDGRVTDIALNKNSEALWSQHYQYDLYQNIAQINKAQPQEKHAQQFAYDKRNRLTQEVSDKVEQHYTYDALGNRLETQQKNSSARAVYGRGNQLRASGDALIVQERGNTLIEKSSTATRFTFYDQRNRPRALYKNKQLIATYGYDVRGWRNTKTTQLDKTKAPLTEHFEYGSEGQLLSEATSNHRKNYVWLGAIPIAQVEEAANDAQIIYLHTDHLATPRVATNAQQKIIWRWSGDAFGKGAPDEDPDRDHKITQINLRFPGQYADAETGLYYNVHRYYDPEKGRYTQSDPLGLADGANSFAYVQGNPLSGADPLGLYNAYTHFYMTYFLAITSGIPQDVALKIALATQYVDENDATNPTSPQITGALSKYHFTLDYDKGYHGDGQSDALTRFYMPSSQQLSRLESVASKSTLDKIWAELHPKTSECTPADDPDTDDARYQLTGEYLHAYEDTFAHRDMNNMSYDKWSFNDSNTPPAIIGHIGPGMPGGWESPDQTYNNTAKVDPECKKLASTGPKSGAPTYTFNNALSESDCKAWGGTYTAGGSWQYNELRTLRMEYEVFSKLKSDFGTEIAANQAQDGKAATWNDLAGTADWDASSSRVGGEAVTKKDSNDKADFSGATNESKLGDVLQQFNAASNDLKYDILNDWLKSHGYITKNMPKLYVDTKGEASLKNSTDDLFNKAAKNRTDFLKWIPQQTMVRSGLNPSDTSTDKHNTADEFGVILPEKQSQTDTASAGD